MPLTLLPWNRVHHLKNVTCVYCGCDLAGSGSTKEHVVGRRFVPKGLLDGQWNLIVRACSACNVRKSDLEDDVSAITLAPPVAFVGERRDSPFAAEAYRKASRSVSRFTGKRVVDSPHEGNITLPLGGAVTATMKYVGPPQLESRRAFELARLQLSAFFYLVTFDEASSKGGFWPGLYVPLLMAPQTDWGNAHFMAFMHAVASWELRFLGFTANECFKIAIRRHPSADTWAWALEWNRNFRLSGFFGDPAPADVIVGTFPQFQLRSAPLAPNGFVSMRLERRLTEAEDSLFAEPKNNG